MTSLNMQTIRYINLLDRVSNVKTSKCFSYNNSIIFAVPEKMVSRAVGRNAENIKVMQDSLGKRIRIVAEASGITEIERFVRDIVSPINFNSVEIRDNVLIISAGGTQNKAGLIGRERRRLDELSQIIKDNFNLDVRIA